MRSRQQSSRRVRRTACSPHACWSICTLALSRTRPGARSTLSLGLANAAHARTHALTNARAHTHTHTHTHTKRIAGPRPSPLPPPSPPRTSLQAARAATEEPRARSSRRVRRTACSPHACWSICTLALSRTRPGARSTLSLGLANAAHARTHAPTNARARTHTHAHEAHRCPPPSPLPPPSPPRTCLQATEEPRARARTPRAWCTAPFQPWCHPSVPPPPLAF